MFSGSKSGRRAGDGHRDGVALAHVLDEQLLALDRVLGRQVGHQHVLADRRARAGRGDVRGTALAVDDPLAAGGQDRLAPEHVPLDARRRGRVVDRQRGHDRRRLLLPVAQVRLLADEVVLLHLRARHPGLGDVVLGLELGAVARGSPSRSARSSRRRRCPPARRRAAGRPPRGRPRARPRPPSARRAPSRARRRRRSGRPAHARLPARPRGSARTESPRARRRRSSPRRRGRARAAPRRRPCTSPRSRPRAAPSRPAAAGRRTTSGRPSRARRR